MVDLPRLCVLGYQATRPRLRLLRLPEEAVEPSPVPLNAARTALDDGFARDGWLVFLPSAEVWGVPVPLQGRAFRVGRWWDCVPALNPRTVWLANPVNPNPDVGIAHDAPTVVVEYDGVARRELRRHELPGSFRAQAVVPAGLVVAPHGDDRDPGHDALELWPWGGDRCVPLASGACVLACHGSRLVVEHRSGKLTLVDASTRAVTPIAKPLAGDWGHCGSFSPDGDRYATSVEEVDVATWTDERFPTAARPPAGDSGAWFADVVRDPERMAQLEAINRRLGEPHWSRLALVDGITGAVTLAEGRFDRHASTPVWTRDGDWLIFDARSARASSPATCAPVRRG